MFNPVRKPRGATWMTWALCVGLLVAACGGGGGGGGAQPPGQPPAQPPVVKAWQGAALIETDDAGSVGDPHIAINSSGVAVAVWYQSDGVRFNIWTNRYEPGKGWGAAELLETNTRNAFDPRVAIDNAGNAVAVWAQPVGAGEEDIRTSRYVPGGGWGPVQSIDSDAGEAGSPQIAMDATGNALVVWQQNDGEQDSIFSNRYTVGVGWDAPELIEGDQKGSVLSPQLAMDGNGNAVAVWISREDTSSRLDVWTNRFVADVGWSAAELLESETTHNASGPHVAMDASGNAMAVWHQNDGVRFNMMARRYVAGAAGAPGTGWGVAQLIETDNLGDAFDAKVVAHADGSAIAVWEQRDGVRFNIWANRYVVGGSWGKAELIETDNAGNAGEPQIGMDAEGNALVVWQQSNGPETQTSTRDNVWINRFTPEGAWAGAELLASFNQGSAGFPQIAMNPSGQAVAVWPQSSGLGADPDRTDIWSNVFR